MLGGVVVTYNGINAAILAMTGGAADSVPLGVEPILFGLFATGWDFLLLGTGPDCREGGGCMTQAMNDREIRMDRMRYVKNTSSSRLCYLAILLNVLYFVSIYKSDVGSWYYQILVGGSIVYNLLFMLMAFLASEGVKNYQKNFSWLLYVLGALQIARIFILPMQAHQAMIKIGSEEVAVMQNAQFIRCIIYLAGSAACLIAAALINQRKADALAKHIGTIGKEAA